jgi:phage terminase large subunit-like protein
MLAFFVHGGVGGNAVALNRRQALFVAEYLKDLNASAAARRAGYSEKSAFRSGVQNMQKSAITDAIAAAMKERAERVQITADKVLADIELIKTDAMREAADKEGKRAMVNHAAALKACELQGRHLQMFVDRVAMTIEQVPDEEIDGRIAELAEKRELLALLTEQERRRSMLKWLSFYPEGGPLRRELYKKHLAFFAAGARYPQRMMMAANRVGKTEGVGAYEVALHLTGNYPGWWPGKRFTRQTRGWAAGDTRQTVRDILVEKLLGPKSARGTGMIPGRQIVRIVPQPGVPDGVELVEVKHASGKVSRLGFKSFDQGRVSFQGTEQDFVWLDEEPPPDVYEECLTRTMTTGGLLLLTFTPLSGLSDVVMMFLPGGDIREQADEKSGRFVVMATWDDVPHLDERTKEMLFASYMPFQRDARTRGVPALGSGAIYPVPESDIVVPDFALAEHWPRCYGMDVGWNRTAAIWGALDRETGTTYLYSQHYRGEAEPIVHAQAIKNRGEWIPGAIDPASRGRSQNDGQQLMDLYCGMGLDLAPADNAVESGIYDTWTLLSAGKLKVFASCQDWINEYRIYRRDDKGAW